MSEANQVNNPDALAIVPLKRKRGRPRKYPKLEADHEGNAHVPGIQNLNCGENAGAPPGFGGVNGNQPRVNGNQPHQVDPVNNAVDAVIGQSVFGVVEATFNDGYLLNVRVGDTETTLKGVVFKPGHYDPVMPENDIAPGVPMIRRNEIPLPRENNTHGNSRKPGPRDRNGTAHAARAANLVGSKGKKVHSVVTQPPTISRGNLVPVVLEPVNLSNGEPSASASAINRTAHQVPFKGKQVLDTTHSSNGSTTTNEIIQLQSQNNHQMIAIPFNQNPVGGLDESEANPLKTAGMPFEKLLTEVIKRVHAPPQSTETNSSSVGHAPPQLTETNSSSAVNLPVEASGIVPGKDASDTDQALSVEPLQVLQPIVDNHPAVASRPSEDHRTGKMTQLLQVLQENMIDNPMAGTEEPDSGYWTWCGGNIGRADTDDTAAALGTKSFHKKNAMKQSEKHALKKRRKLQMKTKKISVPLDLQDMSTRLLA
ncbi:unnamed protein product [Dovyalis caffra]|uniref:Uncharacterized protein n=1 Tax=Dovyalis caffra TaxID=77055 RepID=A0AAV1RS15_9ROSI|nr:unnamed protein product [Dovyalis caffra]